MQLGMVGLGKMGANMTKRLIEHGHELVVTDLSSEAIRAAESEGASGTASLQELVSKLDKPRAIWVMVPSGNPTESAVMTLRDLVDKDDIIIDGGNSNYKDTMRRATTLTESGVHMVDVGTSGGVWGLKEGYSMMIGGKKEIVDYLSPIFESLAPSAESGWGYVGPHGAGHFVKMVHNGIEYGVMQAYAEGFSIMREKTAFELDLAEISRIWQHGSVVRSWLLDLIKDALDSNQTLEDIAPYVPDSGEGRWTVFEAIDLNVSAPIITLALLRRIRSREDYDFTDRMLSVMRNQFGGHAVKKKD